MTDWNRDSALAQIEKCQFECIGGPIENNVAFRWLSERLKEGPKFLPGQQVWFEVATEVNDIKLSKWVLFWVCGVNMSSSSIARTWTYSLTTDRPDAYHYGKVLFPSVAEDKLHESKPEPVA